MLSSTITYNQLNFADHQTRYGSCGRVHGLVSPDTILIESQSPTSNRQVKYLKDPLPHDRGILAFQSITSLQKTICGPSDLPLDYLDDLESFFYVIAWFALGYSYPEKRRNNNDIPAVLASWALTSDPQQCMHAKKEMLYGKNGDFGFNNVSQYLGGYALEELLQNLLGLLRTRRHEKLSSKPPMTRQQILKASQATYEGFLACIKQTIRILDEKESNGLTHKMIASHEPLYPQDLKAMQQRNMETGYQRGGQNW